MNQYTMIEKALSEHKRLSTITGAQVLSISIVIHIVTLERMGH